MVVSTEAGDKLKSFTAIIAAAIISLSQGLYAAPARADNTFDHPINFVKHGPLAKELNIPTYEWMPSDCTPHEMVLAVHGLTLHGRSYELMGKVFALGGIYFTSFDMRGFGVNQKKFTPNHEFCDEGDCKWHVDYEKSYNDLVRVATALKKKNPGLKLTVVGESLGATLAVQIAGEHPELIDKLILSAPAVRLNHAMFTNSQTVVSSLYALAISPKFSMNLHGFISKLVSNNPKICEEMLNDPLVRKEMPLSDLLKTDMYVGRTLKYAKLIQPQIPILTIQGGKDHCVIPEAIVQLSEVTHSTDQTLRWLDQTGHLLLETSFLKPGTVNSLDNWFDNHQDGHMAEIQVLHEGIRGLGGKID